MNQTNNRIREECSVDYNLSPQSNEVLKDEFAKEFGIKVTVNDQKDVVKKFLMEKFWKLSILEDISDWWLSKIDELLKSQRDSLVEKIQEYKMYYNPIGDDINKGRRLACDDIISIIK